MPVKEHVAVHLDMGQRSGVVGPGPAITRVGHQQVRPSPHLPSGVARNELFDRYLQLVVNDQEIVGAESLGQRVRLARKLPNVVGVGEPREVGGLCGTVLGVRRGGIGVPLRVDLKLAQGVGAGVGVLVQDSLFNPMPMVFLVRSLYPIVRRL